MQKERITEVLQVLRGTLLVFLGVIYAVMFKEMMSNSLRSLCFERNIPPDLAVYLFGIVPCGILIIIGVDVARGADIPWRVNRKGRQKSGFEKLFSGELSVRSAIFCVYIPFCLVAVLIGHYIKVRKVPLAILDVLVLAFLLISLAAIGWGVWKCASRNSTLLIARRAGIFLILSVFLLFASWFVY